MARQEVERRLGSELNRILSETALATIPQDGQVITTYSQDRVIAGIPPAPTPEEDRQLLRETGRKVVEECQQLTQTA